MTEQEKYECFAIPPHVWTDQDVIRDQAQLSGWTRRNWVYRDGASLGAEAFPSPRIDTL
jgi:hypothetical protein